MAGDQLTREIIVKVNNKAFKTTERELTGAQIKTLAQFPNDYELFRVEGHNSVPIGNDELVQLKDDEQFRMIVSGTFGVYGFAPATF
jgi:hypothetical protein